MKENIIVAAEFSTSLLQQECEKKKKQFMLVALAPLLLPICILLYIFAADMKFADLDGLLQFFFWGAIIVTAVLFWCSTKSADVENEKIYTATRLVEKESLIVTNDRIYGHDKTADFSYPYCDVIKAYYSRTVGQPPVLIIKLKNEKRLEFEYAQNMSTIISCINDCKEKSKKQAIANKTAAASETTEKTASPSVLPHSESKSISDNCLSEGDNCKLYNIVITSGSGSLSQIKALRQVTLYDLDTAKKVFSQLPYTVAESQEKNEALQIKRILEAAGITITLSEK